VCRTADDGTPAGHLRWRVLADGREIFAEERAAGAEALAAQHAVPLPVDGGRLRLAFEVTGDAGLAAFLTPVVGPSSIGTYGARPWKEGHPDVVLFLADTFRADNMALYGGDPALTPSLDRFAAGALRFLRARSTSTWTLPSHAAMFSGLYPYQSDVHTGRSRLPDEAVTIAEQLRAAGYRTGAVTDQGFVNSSFGLAQGFDRFDEEWSDFDRTLEGVREFLDADDGRPAFLFVHTYRTHVPYVVSAATRARLGEHLGLPADVDYDSLQAAIARIPPDLDPDAVPPGEIARTVHDVVALYRGTAADLDADFEELRGALEARGLLQGGALIFTSDHGEGVFEHGTAGHGRWMWEGNVRIPLLIRWKGAPPGDVALGASNVDLPRTIAAIAGVPPAAGWQGANLLALDEDRPTPTYQCLEDGSPSLLAVVEDGRKLIAPADPAAVGAAEVRQAYDLGHDPGERADAVASGAAWPRERLRALAPWLLPTLEPRLSAGGAELAPEELERLRALGYAGAH